MDMNGKRVVVTGGTAGIGREIARILAARGASVLVCGRRAVALEGVTSVVADLCTPAGRAALVEAAGPVDVLIHNAGVQRELDLRDPDVVGWTDEEVALNLVAPIALTAALLPGLHQRPEAAIVNVTSGLALAPKASAPVYCATKAGLRSFTLALRAQLAGTAVRVVEAMPPVTDTGMTAGRDEAKASPREVAEAICAGLARGDEVIRVGSIRALHALWCVAPWAAERALIQG